MSTISHVARQAAIKLPDLGLGPLSSGHWYIYLPPALLVYILGVVLYRICFHPLAKYPGPFLARFSGSWRNQRFWRGTWHEDIISAHKTYGPIVRIAHNELSIVDEAATKLLYGHGSKALKTSWYSTWQDPTTGEALFATQNKNMHSFLRKRVAGVYSMTSMARYEPYIQDLLNLTWSKLEKHAKATGVVNMSTWTDALTFDIVGELAYGAPLGHLETETDAMSIRQIVHDFFFAASNFGHYPGQMLWFTHPIVTKLRSVLGLPDGIRTFREWAREKVEARQRNNEKEGREDMLDHFLKMKTAEGEAVRIEEVMIEGLNLVGAGADTTSIGMKACLFYLCKNPEWYRKVQAEVDDYYASESLEFPITYQQTQSLPLLCAAVREALRLLPSIVWPLYRYAPPGLEVAGHDIPVGTVVSMSPISANRNRRVWGEDADVFRPERWMEDAEKTKFLNSNDMTFGGNGARMCIGKNLALIEVHKFVAQLLHRFDLEFVDPAKPWRIHSQWFANQHDMLMKIKIRQKRDEQV